MYSYVDRPLVILYFQRILYVFMNLNLSGLCNIHRNYPPSFNCRETKAVCTGKSLRHCTKSNLIQIQSLLRSLSPSHGRGLIYVWAVEQDEHSKRAIPQPKGDEQMHGQDVFVPWVLSNLQKPMPAGEETSEPKSQVYNRYYHMFEKGELRALVLVAAHEMGIIAAPSTHPHSETQTSGETRFIDIVKDDWERSNFYVEFRLYKR